MSNTIHSFDDDGYYAGSAELPPFATGHNPASATLDPLPKHNPLTERLRRVNGSWTVELIPLPELTPEPAPPTLEESKDALKKRITAKRWAVETGGVMVGGMRVLTGIEDQNRITTVVANARRSGLQTVDFKAAGAWVTISVADVEAIACAIALHVQASFTAERAHHEAIDALPDLAAVQVYDVTAGWPV